MSMLYQQLADAEILESMADSANCVTISDEDLSTLFAVQILESYGEEGVDEVLGDDDDDDAVSESVNGPVDAVMERTIVKLDKRAKKNKAYKTALYTVARDADDRDYKQLVTLWKMEKFLTRKIEKKYANKARARMKEMKRAAAAKSKNKSIFGAPARAVKAMTNAFTKSEKESQKAKHLGAAPKGLVSQSKGVMSRLSSKVK